MEALNAAVIDRRYKKRLLEEEFACAAGAWRSPGEIHFRWAARDVVHFQHALDLGESRLGYACAFQPCADDRVGAAREVRRAAAAPRVRGRFPTSPPRRASRRPRRKNFRGAQDGLGKRGAELRGEHGQHALAEAVARVRGAAFARVLAPANFRAARKASISARRIPSIGRRRVSVVARFAA